MSIDPRPGSEVERWGRIEAEMLSTLRADIRLGIVTQDQYSQIVSDVTARIGEHREQAALRDLRRWADEIAASGDPRDTEFAISVRHFIMETRRRQGKLGPRSRSCDCPGTPKGFLFGNGR